MKNITRSLADLLGMEYLQAVKDVAVNINGMDPAEVDALINEKVDFFPADYVKRAEELAAKTGTKVVDGFDNQLVGAPTDSFRKATNYNAAPIGGCGVSRIGQDGRVYMVAKSEHYHTPLGHNFPAFKLITNARRLGILNATHNNTRGYITRLMEQRVIAAANGVEMGSPELAAVLESKEPCVLNRVINLQTGSLAVEAAIKMMLSRFYRAEDTAPAPKYEGKIPVFMVMEDDLEGKLANYHGTTIFAQTLRGMWPEFYAKCEENELYKIVTVKKNDLTDFEAKLKKYNEGKYKTAGFMHEIILMNYAAIQLSVDFLQKAYKLCHEYDTFTLSDEIQSCMWYDGMFLFKQYGIPADFVIIGKGFPGGEYAASKVLCTAEADSLSQFGALVTNGQEELASLAYIITMEFVSNNGAEVAEMGKKIEAGVAKLAAEYPEILDAPAGLGHMTAFHFHCPEKAAAFNKAMNAKCFDVSAQIHKAECPPTVLLKLPLVTTEPMLNVLLAAAKETLEELK